MDLRKERTKRNIINAFLELRSNKSLEKITVKELSELALINKATFYTHYSDIYDLSEQLEFNLIDSILKDIPHPALLIAKPKQGAKELTEAMLSYETLINILFADSRSSVLIKRLENGLKNSIFTSYPEYKDNLEWNILLTVLIQGCFNAFSSYIHDTDINSLVDIIGNINQALISSYTNNAQNFNL